MKKYKKTIICLGTFLLILAVFFNFSDAKQSALSGIILSINVIIPSLLPFMFLVNILSKTVNKMNVPMIFLLSVLGGYPVGAGLIEELYVTGKISKKNAHLFLCFCVNAGPSFIISAVGIGILGSKTAGFVLFSAHIISSLVLFLIFTSFTDKNVSDFNSDKNSNISEIIVKSMEKSCFSLIFISGYIVIFSVICSFLKNIKPIMMLLEITNSVYNTENIYIISFLLGFSGLCVWFQIISILKKSGLNIILFVISRTAHGLLSVLFSFIIIKLFKFNVSALSTINKPLISDIKCSVFLIISLVVMIISFLAEINRKKRWKF